MPMSNQVLVGCQGSPPPPPPPLEPRQAGAPLDTGVWLSNRFAAACRPCEQRLAIGPRARAMVWVAAGLPT